MKFYRQIFVVFVLVLASVFVSCKGKSSDSSLKVDLISEATYKSEDSLVSAKFYALSDKSLCFVKLQTNEESLTLTRAISASGERYVSESENVEFFVKGNEALIEYRDLENNSESKIELKIVE